MQNDANLDSGLILLFFNTDQRESMLELIQQQYIGAHQYIETQD